MQPWCILVCGQHGGEAKPRKILATRKPHDVIICQILVPQKTVEGFNFHLQLYAIAITIFLRLDFGHDSGSDALLQFPSRAQPQSENHSIIGKRSKGTWPCKVLAHGVRARGRLPIRPFLRKTACQPLQRCEQPTSCPLSFITSLHSSALHRLHTCRKSLDGHKLSKSKVR